MNTSATPGMRLQGRWKWLWLPICGGLIFSAVFAWRYAGIDPDIYQFRDDGVITLSHGRNWVDFGFIGLNPSGERIEASSAPLQLLLYAAAYALSGVDYQTFMNLQTLLCTFALGTLFVLLFPEKPLYALGACAGGALVLTQLPAFLIWHGSGMENPLTHVFLLGSAVLLLHFARQARIDMRWAVVPFLASITRVEAIFHVGPMLLVFCIWWQTARRDDQARRFAAWVGGLWILFNLARYAYFGTLMPNTAVAQGISVGDRVLELVTLSPTYLDQSFGLARTNFTRHGGYLLFLALPFVLLRRPMQQVVLPLAVIGSLLLTAFVAPFFFGPARLDVSRTTTQMAPLVVASIAVAAYGWKPRRSDAYVLPLTLVLVFLGHEYLKYGPTMACCSTRDFDMTRQAFARIAREQGIPRPTVANPDLGVVSWHKQFNVVDLGLLGSALVSRLGQGPALNDYLLEHAAPDIIETHGWWTCLYAGYLRDPRFTARYVEATAPGRQFHACKDGPVPTGVWVRRDVLRDSGSRERALMDALTGNPSVERLAAEMQACQSTAGAAPACGYVARSAYRVLPELRALGAQDRLEAVFRDSATREHDLWLLAGAAQPRRWQAALAWLQGGH